MATTKKQVIASLSLSEARAALDAALKREQVLTQKRNRAFKRLPGYKQRLTIAQDVLDQLDAKRLIPTFGKYLVVPDEIDEKFSSGSDSDGDLKINEVLQGVSCQVCGIGSIFVAAVDRANECVVSDMDETGDDNFMREYLDEWFSEEQLHMIETAFEGRIIRAGEWFDDSDDDKGTDAAHEALMRSIRFTRRLQSPDGRLRKIMKNIIENRGEFVP